MSGVTAAPATPPDGLSTIWNPAWPIGSRSSPSTRSMTASGGASSRQAHDEPVDQRVVALDLDQHARASRSARSRPGRARPRAGRRRGGTPRPAPCPRRAAGCGARRSRSSGRGWVVDEIAQRVVRGGLRLLDSRDVLGPADHDVVGQTLAGDPPAVVSDQRDRPQPRAGAPRPAPGSRSPTRRTSRSPAACRRRAPWAITCRENIASAPMSFAIAVRIAGSSVRSIAGRRRGRAGGLRKSATTSIASVADPPLPNASSLPPRREPRPQVAAAADQRVPVLGQRLARAGRRPPRPSSAPIAGRRRRRRSRSSSCSARNG